ncbi:MAG TPA: hypothetical protein VHY22_13145 [Chthoniobacteraceae bacterium]|jgi:hypothetical protein|nr:hypothetical protein [Chthoniobacteraceae bacterium]
MKYERGQCGSFLFYCIPALIVGIILRGMLTAGMPYGYVQYDSAEYLETPYKLLHNWSFFVDGKRGFLVPLLFTIPFLLHLPALILIPLGQHLLGLAATVMSGAITRLWFRWWRWAIVPVTLFVAANPMMLWYEQTIMGESEFLFALIFLALAGTLWTLERTRGRFILFLVALVCTAGARPEGRLFFAFGLLLAALNLWGQWRALAKCTGAMLAVALAGALIVRQSTAPQLLYASLIQLAPDHSRFVPGIDPYIIPLRDEVRTQSGGDPLQLVKVSKKIRDDIDPYLWTHITNRKMYYRELNRTLRNLCLDAILAHPVEALKIPIAKFRTAVDSWSAYQFSPQALGRTQVDAWTADKDKPKYLYLSKGLTGRTLDEPGIDAFIAAHYNAARIAWLTHLQRAWNAALVWRRTADRPVKHPRWVHDFAGGVRGGLYMEPGWPWFYPLAVLGMLAAMVRRDAARRFHLAWAPVLLGVWYAATFVGVTNARYRFAYEPFCFIYLCLLVDGVARIMLRQRLDMVSEKPAIS